MEENHKTDKRQVDLEVHQTGLSRSIHINGTSYLRELIDTLATCNGQSHNRQG